MSRSIASTTNNRLKYKVVFLGDQGVGKSCIIDRFINERFDENTNPTVGIDFMVRNLSYKGKNYRLQLWDTAGQERFRSLIPGYLKDAMCAVFVCDASKADSTANLESWMSLFSENKAENSISVICSNKIDLATSLDSLDEGDRVAKKFGMHHFKVSAKTGENIPQMFNGIIDLINRRETKKQDTGVTPPLQSPPATTPSKTQPLKPVTEAADQVPPITLSASQANRSGGHRETSKCC